MTAGDQITEEARAKLARKINRVYSKVQKDIAKDSEKYFSRFLELAEKNLALVKDGKMSMAEYTTWANNKMLYGERFVDLQEVVAERLTDTNVTAAAYINDAEFDVFMENQRYEQFLVEQGCGASFSMYSEQTVRNLIKNNPKMLPEAKIDIPKDQRWNKDKMRACLVSGIARGVHPSKLALELQKVTDMNKVSAMRNARTMITGAQNAGRQNSLERADEMGLEVYKEWNCSFVRSRESHMELDGERVKVNEVFSNGCRFPGDHWGEPAEVYNCKCTLDGVFPETPKSTRYEDFKRWEAEKEDDLVGKINAIIHGDESAEAREIRKTRNVGEQLNKIQILTGKYLSTKSNWSGKYDIDNKRSKPASYNYQRNEIILRKNASIKNKIHEMIHSYNIRNGTAEERAQYKKLNEGCTDMLARIICDENGIKYKTSAKYDVYVSNLKTIADATNYSHKDFAVKLLEMPYMDRYNWLEKLIDTNVANIRGRFEAVQAWKDIKGDVK